MWDGTGFPTLLMVQCLHHWLVGISIHQINQFFRSRRGCPLGEEGHLGGAWGRRGFLVERRFLRGRRASSETGGVSLRVGFPRMRRVSSGEEGFLGGEGFP